MIAALNVFENVRGRQSLGGIVKKHFVWKAVEEFAEFRSIMGGLIDSPEFHGSTSYRLPKLHAKLRCDQFVKSVSNGMVVEGAQSIRFRAPG